MKANVFYSKDSFEVKDFAIPKIDSNEVLLKVHACGLCGTDIHKAIHESVNPGTILGHEYAGEIVEIGSQVTDFEIGDRVVGGIHVPCLTCHYCERGHYTLCPEFKKTNIEPGGFAEYIRLSERHVRNGIKKIPEGMSYEVSAMAEPVACCIHGQKSAHFHPGDNVLIMGAGPIGLIHAQLLKQKNLGNIFITDMSAYKLKIAKKLGIDYPININNEDLNTVINEVTDNQGVDKIIIATGISQLLPQAVKLLRRGGEIIVFSPFDNNSEVTIDASRFFADEISIVGTYSVSPYEFNEALIVLENGTIDVENMITHVMDLEQVQEAINLANNPNKEAIKIIIKNK
ncbi:zinc-dependent dehydrogenase [Staphylococcus pseudoxylosus]|uniref:L-iditol 2-dehydrogenase n=1 Tax=Staphylococcus pseudoxylosus TaxID=2282419 RepID=A0AAQ0S5X1_9STAP|nr:zinc-dependent dehydrogenase [Staphylococcus pseudoxylosus]MCE5003666.1 zinc-dependent dehydrogenase [Staphylococcus pseudoxylosus]RMI83881.1 L-iditol 2-dehydrogenase [Staphylococcus pseudoxylosus]